MLSVLHHPPGHFCTHTVAALGEDLTPAVAKPEIESGNEALILYVSQTLPSTSQMSL